MHYNNIHNVNVVNINISLSMFFIVCSTYLIIICACYSSVCPLHKYSSIISLGLFNIIPSLMTTRKWCNCSMSHVYVLILVLVKGQSLSYPIILDSPILFLWLCPPTNNHGPSNPCYHDISDYRLSSLSVIVLAYNNIYLTLSYK